MSSDVYTKEFQALLEDLTTGDATVSSGVVLKVSDASKYGSGTWDKIPYSVEIHTRVTIPCKTDVESLMAASGMAHQMASEAANESLGEAKERLCYKIETDYYKELFGND